MRALVTGAAGFIGSHLCERLLREGHEVLGVDCFTDYYPRHVKSGNLRVAETHPGFQFVDADLRTCDVAPLFSGVDVVFHQAGQPGVRLSWADGFDTYVDCNVKVTQRLLEAAQQTTLDRFVYASSSSVYGEADRYPVVETDVPSPRSPYGVTKLAAEHLMSLYAANFGVPTTSLRYFTVYGPRQRPDMAIQRLVAAGVDHESFTLFGDGSQIGDFTFVEDIVAANVLAAGADTRPGEVLNLSGGSSASMRDVIDQVEIAVGSPLRIERTVEQPGDVSRTGGDSSRAYAALGWRPQVHLAEGVRRQVEYERGRRSDGSGSDARV